MTRYWMLIVVALVAMQAARADDAVTRLARLLADKGLISREELAAVQRSGPEEAVALLTDLLARKGLLTASEVAAVVQRSPGGAGDVRFVPVVAANATPAPAPVQAPRSTGAETAGAVTTASKSPLQFYGTILWNAFGNTAGTNVEDIPLVASKNGSDPYQNFGMTARQSRFGLRFQGPDVFGAKMSGTMEMDFFGGKTPLTNGVNMDIFRLRLAYGRLDWHNVSIEAGQDWAVFSPLNPTSLASFAIPSMSASGNPWIRSPQFRFESRAEHLLFQAAVLDPNIGDNPTTVVDARTPGIGERGGAPAVESRLAAVGKIGDRDVSVGFSGHYNRGLNVGTIGSQTATRGVDSWGVNLDYTLPFHRRFGLTGEAFVGRALGLFSVASGEAVLPPGTPGEHGVLARGGWMQAQINLNPRWQINAAYGIEAMDPANLRVGDRAKNQTYMANLMRKLNQRITLSWEWRRILTDYRNQQTANAIIDLANMGIAYTF
ncbi:MAG TPA: hypothetical protein VKU01_29205 [Bryobacteraceae bacterium]|nr:hypothetical protein [Bryobacteraceae bacterium]